MGSSLSTPKNDPQVEAHIQRLVAENPVIAFTKVTCPYCASTKLILKQKRVQHVCIDVDITSGGSALHHTLKQMTGQRTVPCIFINGQRIGGNSELRALKKSGELDKMLESVPRTADHVG
ncbi:hypothetical protein JDV02_010721 [Purpureocillium takamizusanense]|uniref:Glutaredoxin domain-containing protein n=1 Tax=Purpureocillium takamizusanense TaxID=2060973 RepID=A0A9Q8QSU8_9HYPO|nr:uncharacterized protein JDV02_010721 [Purpureocillium takamizusanense]UNI25013.1 hypothetical protein JDV02_010721 [Purpureocillium takamizusanense]